MRATPNLVTNLSFAWVGRRSSAFFVKLVPLVVLLGLTPGIVKSSPHCPRLLLNKFGY